MQSTCERLALVATIDPASLATGEALTDAIDLSMHRRVLFVVATGVLGAAATLDFVVKGATSAGGTYAAIPGATLAQIVKASGDNVQAIFEISPEFVENLALGYTHIKGSLTVGGAASLACVVAFGDHSRYGPAADYDLASVVQIAQKVN